MKCPIDGAALVMTERSGVEIDYCPQCRGVWLDRGELDKIIDRSAPPPPVAQPSHPDHNQGYGHGTKHYRKKKESFLSDLFDF